MTSPDHVQTLANASPSFRRMMEGIEARKRWAEENPELAAAWDEANREDNERQKRKEYAQRERHWDVEVPNALRRTSIPLDAIDALSDLRETESTKAARRFMDAPTNLDGRFLVFFGRRGVGKTTAAALVAREVVRRWVRERDLDTNTMLVGVPVEFVLSTTFSRLSGYDKADRDWFERMCSVRLLILDDFGTEHLGDYGKTMLDELLTRRHGDRLRTVITTNLDKKAFAERVGERLFDRISTSGISCVSVGESMRKRGGK